VSAPLELIDSHAHLDVPQFADDLAGVIACAREVGVSRIITVGIDLPSSRKAIELAHEYSGVFAAVGIHPEEAGNAAGDDLQVISQLAQQPGVVAIGEIGLDLYHEDYPARDTQLEIFRQQLELARRLGLPAVIHCRQAEEVLMPALQGWLNEHHIERPGVIHCFSGALETAQEYLKMGFYISLGGYIGYPSSKKLRQVVKELTLDRLLLETDSPFLPPQSRRGQRNEPAYMAEPAQTLADIKEVSLAGLAAITTANAQRLFNLPT
jgi:TatD DNase family protein